MSRSLEVRAKEISDFLGHDYDSVVERLKKGFHENHRLVAEDFNNAGTDVNSPESLLNWYRNTDAYIYELTAYHLEEGFNYSGMCEGIAKRCQAITWDKVLCLGDGIGDLSIDLKEAGLNPIYHDLSDSKNAGYFASLDNDIPMSLTDGWTPDMSANNVDAVVALDFFEHLVNVEEWAQKVYEVLVLGGGFLAQNAFAIGDQENGNSIPMHLSINNKYQSEWSDLMYRVGFSENVGGWWIK